MILTIISLLILSLHSSYENSFVAPNTIIGKDLKRKLSEKNFEHPKKLITLDDIAMDFQNIKEDNWQYKFSVVMRGLYLLMIFSPVFLTAVFAMLSTAFRTYIWFNLLTTTIAYSGAVSVIFYILHMVLKYLILN
jgi:hypothetical protein